LWHGSGRGCRFHSNRCASCAWKTLAGHSLQKWTAVLWVMGSSSRFISVLLWPWALWALRVISTDLTLFSWQVYISRHVAWGRWCSQSCRLCWWAQCPKTFLAPACKWETLPCWKLFKSSSTTHAESSFDAFGV
jgi:hypothetical protein